MHILEIVLNSFILAIGLILPLGPQNTLILTQGIIQKRKRRVIPIVVTAACCDTILIVLGVTTFSTVFSKLSTSVTTVITILGSLFILYISYGLWKMEVDIETDSSKNHSSIKEQILYTISISILNPGAILDTIAVMGSVSLQYTERIEKLAFTLSCIAVSWIYFFTLMFIGRYIDKLVKNVNFKKQLNKLAAIVTAICSIKLLLSVI